ncbi:MAG TPA: response regulator [Chitinophagaceae bacterium]|nr:response regulator [Chitinophagaceae bacterium]
MQAFSRKFNIRFKKLFGDYFFLFLLITGVAVNYYFEMKANRAMKKFTADHEKLQQYRGNADQVFVLGKAVLDFENHVLVYINTGDTAYLRELKADQIGLQRDIVVLTDKLRTIVSQSDMLDLRRILQKKMAFESSLVDIYREEGKAKATAAFLSEESVQIQKALSQQYSRVYDNAQAEIEKMNAKLRADRLEIISLDYAMPHLISFIFLVIGGFILFKILQVIRLNRNLSEAVEKEQKAQQVKDQFMDNMTHELRSPLNSVLGYTNLLLRSPLNGDQEKFVKSIRTSGELLLNVINEVLDFSKIKSGYIHFSNDPFSFREQMNALSDIVRDKIMEKGLKYECTIDENIPDHLKGDSSKLLQVLLNLTSNAIKFTKEGVITVTATCKAKTQDRITVAVWVSDTGIGIPADKLPNIFDRFFQVTGSGARNQSGGTGLGLSITREMLALQGGNIHVESEEGKGSVFFVEIPYEIVQETDVETENDGQNAGRRAVLPFNMKVLVVDDNNMNRELVAFILRDFGVKYTLVPGGPEALSILSRENFDVVLMDLQMPGMDGRETTKRIREDLKSEVPIVALSAYSHAQEKQKCLEAGMDAYLTKPVKDNDLFETLEMYAPATEPATIDMVYLKSIAKGNTEYIETVILKVADNLPREIEELKHALYENDQEKVNILAHDMKTTFAVLGVSQAVAEPIRFLESWKASPKSLIKAGKMLEIIESVGAEVTFQILDTFANPDTKAEDGQIIN